MTTTVPYAADVPGAINTGMIFSHFPSYLAGVRGFRYIKVAGNTLGGLRSAKILLFEKCYLTGTIFFSIHQAADSTLSDCMFHGETGI